MLIDFFLTVKKYKVPCTIKELLALIDALEQGIAFADVDQFYHLSRLILVKNENHFDRFDRAFADYFKGVASIDILGGDLPEDWLNNALINQLSEEEKKKIEALGGLDKLMETLKQRLAEQKERHQGGSKWIGTGGTSPFGAYGYNPEGVRIGQADNRNFSAAKVWDKREFKNLDDDNELSSRNMQLALRKLRRFARTGAHDELDLSGTIKGTANKGYLDIQMRKERHNAVKVIVLFDIGGSMDFHVEQTQLLFDAVHSEFKHLEYYYFHNCVYESVWKDNKMRRDERIDTLDLVRKYGKDYKLIFVGDATMGPYEITMPGGSVEHWNEQSGQYWLSQLLDHFSKSIWLNPQPKSSWNYHYSIDLVKQIMEQKMFALTPQGISEAIGELL